MEIRYLGHASFYLGAKNAKVVMDPFDPEMVGLSYPQVKADIVTVSHQHQDHNAVSLVKPTQRVDRTSDEPAPFIISGPGEYEIRGTRILGIDSFHDNKEGAKRGRNTIYEVIIDGVNIVHLGDLGHKLSQEQLDALNNVEVLLAPVGGVYTVNPEQIKEIINLLSPNIVVPMHFYQKGMKPETFGQLATVEDFLKLMEAENVKTLDKLVVEEGKLPEETEIVVLK